jgi:hypothetical protein
VDALVAAAYPPGDPRRPADGPRVLVAAAAEAPGVPGTFLVLAALEGAGGGVRFEATTVGAGGPGGLARRGAVELDAGRADGGTPFVEVAGEPAIGEGCVRARAGFALPGGGRRERLALYRAAATGRPAELLAPPAATTWPEGDPRERVTRAIEVLPTRTGGIADLLVRSRTALCPGGAACLANEEAASFVFDGQRHRARPFAVPFVERAAASSELSSPGAMESHAAGAAVDGVAATSWCEGVPGPGPFQKLELAFSPPQALAALRLLPAAQVDGAPARRPARVRIVLPGGRRVEAPLPDAPGPHRVALPRAARADGLQIVFLAAHPGPGDHTCLAEVEPELAP